MLLVVPPVCAIALLPSAGGKNAPDATSLGPSTAPTQPAGSSDIFPLYALSQAINTTGSWLVNVLLLKF